nr:MAG: putative RING finger protein [Diabrotica toursvirus 3a]
METLNIFEQTEMYNVLCEIEKNLNIDLNILKFKKSCPFWKSDEETYISFLEVLKSTLMLMRLEFRRTRSMVHANMVFINGTIDMLMEHIPDDDSEADINSRCVICMFNKATVIFNCKHKVVCNKCNMIMNKKRIQTCPLCRRQTLE